MNDMNPSPINSKLLLKFFFGNSFKDDVPLVTVYTYIIIALLSLQNQYLILLPVCKKLLLNSCE